MMVWFCLIYVFGDGLCFFCDFQKQLLQLIYTIWFEDVWTSLFSLLMSLFNFYKADKPFFLCLRGCWLELMAPYVSQLQQAITDVEVIVYSLLFVPRSFSLKICIFWVKWCENRCVCFCLGRMFCHIVYIQHTRVLNFSAYFLSRRTIHNILFLMQTHCVFLLFIS